MTKARMVELKNLLAGVPYISAEKLSHHRLRPGVVPLHGRVPLGEKKAGVPEELPNGWS